MFRKQGAWHVRKTWKRHDKHEDILNKSQNTSCSEKQGVWQIRKGMRFRIKAEFIISLSNFLLKIENKIEQKKRFFSSKWVKNLSNFLNWADFWTLLLFTKFTYLNLVCEFVRGRKLKCSEFHFFAIWAVLSVKSS